MKVTDSPRLRGRRIFEAYKSFVARVRGVGVGDRTFGPCGVIPGVRHTKA